MITAMTASLNASRRSVLRSIEARRPPWLMRRMIGRLGANG
jgi:hypothetical protein